jgi:hypothetical protein
VAVVLLGGDLDRVGGGGKRRAWKRKWRDVRRKHPAGSLKKKDQECTRDASAAAAFAW